MIKKPTSRSTAWGEIGDQREIGDNPLIIDNKSKKGTVLLLMKKALNLCKSRFNRTVPFFSFSPFSTGSLGHFGIKPLDFKADGSM
jgi:hypothetical protein